MTLKETAEGPCSHQNKREDSPALPRTPGDTSHVLRPQRTENILFHYKSQVMPSLRERFATRLLSYERLATTASGDTALAMHGQVGGWWVGVWVGGWLDRH